MTETAKHAYKSNRQFFAKCKVCGESMTHDNHFTEKSDDAPVGRWIRGEWPKRVP